MYPNPFNPTTTIRFGIPETTVVRLVIYDLLGRTIETLIDAAVGAGMHEVVFDASYLPSGTYLFTLEAAGEVRVGSMLLAK